jgi:hypothetical protein
VVREEDEPKNNGWFSSRKNKPSSNKHVSRPPTATSFGSKKPPRKSVDEDEDLPPRMDEKTDEKTPGRESIEGERTSIDSNVADSSPEANRDLPVHAGFDFNAIKEVIGKAGADPRQLEVHVNVPRPTPPVPSSSVPQRSASAPRSFRAANDVVASRSSLDLSSSVGGGGGGERGRSRLDLESPLSISPTEDSLATARPGRLSLPSASPFDEAEDDVDTPWASTSPDKLGTSIRPNPFAYGSFSSFSPPTQMTFGTVNGSLSPGIADPWGSGGGDVNDRKKSPPGFNANPWS